MIEIEHKIGENSFKIENTGKGEDSYITIILYPKEIDNVQLIDYNSYKILNKFEYGLIKLDKNYKDKYLAIFSNYPYEFNFNYSFIILDSEKKYIPSDSLFITKPEI